MNKTWLTLIIIGVVMLLVNVGYQFYASITGGNLEFTKTVNQISGDLGKTELDSLTNFDQFVLVKDNDLNNK